ncbi:YdeI/OmpD-associated family protein [Singulisphaera sp. Ch08]|uniref:YdeI/OmpD-associated family protein n=1 Tax=Singulisphaera sp. Ch08 TaxID=3120278 RepID=A0AAU7CTA3_9BACT
MASYRKAASWWVASAKNEKTRLKFLDSLVVYSARAERIPQHPWKNGSG